MRMSSQETFKGKRKWIVFSNCDTIPALLAKLFKPTEYKKKLHEEMFTHFKSIFEQKGRHLYNVKKKGKIRNIFHYHRKHIHTILVISGTQPLAVIFGAQLVTILRLQKKKK